MHIHEYNIWLRNGQMFTITASNKEGAAEQVKSFSHLVERIERVYQTGERNKPPFEKGQFFDKRG